MPDERALRIAAMIGELGADVALFTSVESVCYASGFAGSVEWGPSPFMGGPNVAVVTREGAVGLVVDGLNAQEANGGHADVVRAYEAFSPRDPLPLRANHRAALADVLAELGAGGVAACEPPHLTQSVIEDVAGTVTGWVDASDAIARTRALKTAREIEQLRYAAEITAVGQRAALEVTTAGRTELAAFALLRNAMEEAVGMRLAITGDYISGPDRTADCEGWPNSREMVTGDAVIADLAPRVHGYWGDSCNTIVIGGEPGPELERMFTASRDALERATEVLRPGVVAGEADRLIRAVLTDAGYANPLHVGHGIGTGVHEFPRIVANESAVLEPDMVLMIEPGAYVPEVGGVRLEWMFRITPDGNEVMSPFEHLVALEPA